MTEAVPDDASRKPPEAGRSAEAPHNERLGSSLFPGGGLEITWSQDVRLEDVLAAAARRARYLAGEDLPGRGDGGQGKRKRRRRRSSTDSTPAGGTPADGNRADGSDTAPGDSAPSDPLGEAGDPLGEEALEAAMSGAGSTVSLAELAGYAILEPGPGLAGWLSSGAAASMDDAALVNSIVSWRKLTSWAQSGELQAVAELAARRGAAGKEAPEDPVKKLEASFAPSEVALALTLTPTSADFWMDLAVSLTGRLPDTLRALGSGRIDMAKARLIYIFTADLDEELARAVERCVLEKAEEQTTGQLRAALQAAAISVDPAAAERRCKEAEKNARVELFGDQDGTASLAGRNLPAAHAAAAWARIGALARALQSSGAGGGLDLLRAQVFVGLLLGTLPIIPLPPDGPADAEPEDPYGGPEGPGSSGPEGPGSSGSGGSGDGGGPSVPASADPDDPGYADSEDPGCPDLDRLGRPDPEDPEDPGCADLDRLRDPDPEDPEEAGCADPGGRGCADPAEPDGLDANSASEAGDSRRAGAAQPADTDFPPGRDDRASPAAPPWPGIPPPGVVSGPGCAPYWPAGTPPPGPSGSSGAGPPSVIRPSSAEQGTGWPGGPSIDLLKKAAMAAKVRLTVPLRTLAGFSSGSGQLNRIGSVTGNVARGLAEAAATNPFCEWRVIITDAKGRAIGVTRPSLRRAGAGAFDKPAPGWVTRIVLTVPVWALADRALRDYCQPATSGRLGVILAAALAAADREASRIGANSQEHADSHAGTAIRDCRHEGAVSGYRVPGRMRLFIEARDQTCGFPPCRQPAWRTDMDHTIPYHLGGPTCPCNLHGQCRRHHRLKQLSGWDLSQPAPGVLVWRTPARLTYTVIPDTYQI